MFEDEIPPLVPWVFVGVEGVAEVDDFLTIDLGVVPVEGINWTSLLLCDHLDQFAPSLCAGVLRGVGLGEHDLDFLSDSLRRKAIKERLGGVDIVILEVYGVEGVIAPVGLFFGDVLLADLAFSDPVETVVHC